MAPPVRTPPSKWVEAGLRALAAGGPYADDVETRCLLSFSLLIGNHFIAADHGPRSRAEVVELSLRHLGA
jgi:hypothetical protein